MRLAFPKAVRSVAPAVALLAGVGLLLAALYPDWFGRGSNVISWRREAAFIAGLALFVAGLFSELSQPPQRRLLTGTPETTRIWRWLVVGGCIVLATFLAWRTLRGVIAHQWGQVLDDAYITLRFSRNLINGYGLRWNPTDPSPLEAFTSLTHVLLGALFLKTGWDPILATRGACLLSVAGIAGLFAVEARRARVWPLGFLIPTALLVGNPFIVFAATTGMDTLFAALAVTISTVVFCFAADDQRYVPGMCLATLACILTRPDTIIFLACLWFFLAVKYRSQRQFWLWVVGGLLLPGAAYASFKAWYFGELLPTSFYFKSRFGQVTTQLPLVTAFLIRFVAPAALVMVAAWVGRQARIAHVWIVLASSLAISYFITVLPSVSIGYRFLVPFYPAILVALVWPAGRLGQLMTAPGQALFHRALAASGLAVLTVAMLPSPKQFALDVASVSNAKFNTIDQVIGQAFSGLPTPQAIVLVTGEAGAIPFYTDMFHVDPFGLVTKDKRTNPFSPDMVFEHNPDIFITYAIAAQAGPDGRVTADPVPIQRYLLSPVNSTPKFSYAIINDVRFANFELVAKIRDGVQPEAIGYHYVFIRRDSPYAAELKARVERLQVALSP